MATARTLCQHHPVPVAGIQVIACPDCGTVEWREQGWPIDPAAAMVRLFGAFDLVGTLPAIQAPGGEVLMYRPPNRQARTRLLAFPEHHWFEVHDGLWLSHDDEHLLLAPTDPLLARNLTRGA